MPGGVLRFSGSMLMSSVAAAETWCGRAASLPMPRGEVCGSSGGYSGAPGTADPAPVSSINPFPHYLTRGMCHLQKSISILISTPRHPPSLFRSQSLPRLSSRVFLAALACFAVALLAFALAAIPLSGPLPEAPCNAISDNPEGLPGPPLGPPPGPPCNAISDPPGGPPGPTLGVSVAPGPPPHGYWWGDSTTPPRSDAGFGPAAVAWLKKMPGAW